MWPLSFIVLVYRRVSQTRKTCWVIKNVTNFKFWHFPKIMVVRGSFPYLFCRPRNECISVGTHCQGINWIFGSSQSRCRHSIFRRREGAQGMEIPKENWTVKSGGCDSFLFLQLIQITRDKVIVTISRYSWILILEAEVPLNMRGLGRNLCASEAWTCKILFGHSIVWQYSHWIQTWCFYLHMWGQCHWPSLCGVPWRGRIEFDPWRRSKCG
jgi:hypothetical protein